jgi:hypothetical protein
MREQFGRVSLILVIAATACLAGRSVMEPKACHVPLVFLNASCSPSGAVREVIVNLGKKDEKWSITPGSDIQYRFNDRVWLEKIWQEVPGEEFKISPKEAEILSEVLSGFCATLTEFEQYLKNGDWDHLLYLDGQLSTFLLDFDRLCRAMFAGAGLLSQPLAPSNSIMGSETGSFGSKIRLAQWKDSGSDIKLRIAAMELCSQLAAWKKKGLAGQYADPSNKQISSIKQTYELFVKLYFGS